MGQGRGRHGVQLLLASFLPLGLRWGWDWGAVTGYRPWDLSSLITKDHLRPTFLVALQDTSREDAGQTCLPLGVGWSSLGLAWQGGPLCLWACQPSLPAPSWHKGD